MSEVEGSDLESSLDRFDSKDCDCKRRRRKQVTAMLNNRHSVENWRKENLEACQLIVIPTADDFFPTTMQKDCLPLSAFTFNIREWNEFKLTCSHWAVYEPLISLSGAYDCTIPLSMRFRIYTTHAVSTCSVTKARNPYTKMIALYPKTI